MEQQDFIYIQVITKWYHKWNSTVLLQVIKEQVSHNIKEFKWDSYLLTTSGYSFDLMKVNPLINYGYTSVMVN